MTGAGDLLAGERDRLLTVLDALDPAGWATPSLCTGWSVREVVVHVLMPYELSTARFLGRLVAARGRFDALADRWARADDRPPVELVEALRGTAGRPFRVPGAGAAGELTHLVAHTQDVTLPLGVDARPAPQAAVTVLDQLTSPRGTQRLAPGLFDGVAVVATDVDWRHGDGEEAAGPAGTLIAALSGRPAAATGLSGPGADLVRRRLVGGSVRTG